MIIRSHREGLLLTALELFTAQIDSSTGRVANQRPKCIAVPGRRNEVRGLESSTVSPAVGTASRRQDARATQVVS